VQEFAQPKSRGPSHFQMSHIRGQVPHAQPLQGVNEQEQKSAWFMVTTKQKKQGN